VPQAHRVLFGGVFASTMNENGEIVGAMSLIRSRGTRRGPGEKREGTPSFSLRI